MKIETKITKARQYRNRNRDANQAENDEENDIETDSELTENYYESSDDDARTVILWKPEPAMMIVDGVIQEKGKRRIAANFNKKTQEEDL